jgi:CRISPR-associated protein Csm2
MSWAQEYAREMENLAQIDPERLVEISKDIGKQTARILKMNQIRRFLDALRKIEQDFHQLTVMKGAEETSQQKAKIKQSLAMLRPKLAYAAGRERNIRDLMEVLEPAIQVATRSPETSFEKLLRLMESIIAYHRFFGGTN